MEPNERTWPRWLAVLKISKVPFWIVWMTIFIYGYLAGVEQWTSSAIFWFVFVLIGICVLESANCIHNELVDQEEDRINQPNRASLITSVGEKTLWRIVVVGYLYTAVGLLVVAVFGSPVAAGLMVLAGLAAPFYNCGPRFKRRPFLAELAIGWATFFGHLSGWVWHQEITEVPTVAWVVTYFFAITSLMKDLPDVRGDEYVRAPGIFSIRRVLLRKLLLLFIYLSPYALIVVLVFTGDLPARLLLLCPLGLAALVVMAWGDKVTSLNTMIMAYELAFLYVHVFMLGLFVLDRPTPLGITFAIVLFMVRLLALKLQLAPRFVEQDFTWSGAFRKLVRPS